MVDSIRSDTARARFQACTTDAAELAWFEGIRAGQTRAFAGLASALHVPLATLAWDLTRDQDAAVELVCHAWQVALGGLELFAWRCRLRAWVTGILVQLGRGPFEPSPGPPAQAQAPTNRVHHGAEHGPWCTRNGAEHGPWCTRTGPVDWADLPWGARWAGVGHVFDAAFDAAPVLERQVLLLADGVGWGPGDTCDALALTRARCAAVHTEGAIRLQAALAGLVGPGPVPLEVQASQQRQALSLVAHRVQAPVAAPPGAVMDTYRRWRRTLPRRRWGLRPRRLGQRRLSPQP